MAEFGPPSVRAVLGRAPAAWALRAPGLRAVGSEAQAGALWLQPRLEGPHPSTPHIPQDSGSDAKPTSFTRGTRPSWLKPEV